MLHASLIALLLDLVKNIQGITRTDDPAINKDMSLICHHIIQDITGMGDNQP
jgi:hypothetical protein